MFGWFSNKKEQVQYLNLAVKPYQTELPDLDNLLENGSQSKVIPLHLRLAGLFLRDITALSKYNLTKLNISYTYVTSLPHLPNLMELSMVEVNLLNPDDLPVNCPNLLKLKTTTDEFEVTKPLVKLTLLHCTVIHRSDTLKERFPNLKELRFEHIHPKKHLIEPSSLQWYTNLTCRMSDTTKVVFQTKSSDAANPIDDFDDKCNDELMKQFNFDLHKWHFATGRLEMGIVNDELADLQKDNIGTTRYGHYMRTLNSKGECVNSVDTCVNNKVKKTIPDEEYVKYMDHLRDMQIRYGVSEDYMNHLDPRAVILKKIIFNNYQLNEEISQLLASFDPTLTESWSVDQLLVKIKSEGMTENLVKQVRIYDRTPKDDNILEGDSESESEEIARTISETIPNPDIHAKFGQDSTNAIINCNSYSYYRYANGDIVKLLEPTEIKDVLWYNGRKYRLTQKQKQTWSTYLKSLNNDEKEYTKAHPIKWVRFDEISGGDDEKSEEEESEEEGSDELYNDTSDSDARDEDDSSSPDATDKESTQSTQSNIWHVCKVPNNRTGYVPQPDPINNIFIDDLEIVASDDYTFDMTPVAYTGKPHSGKTDMNLLIRHTLKPNESVQVEFKSPDDKKNLSIFSIFDSTHFLHADNAFSQDTNRNHLYFYGKSCNLSTNLITNSNGYIMLGTGGDEGCENLVDALLDKAHEKKSLCLTTAFFVFKNRVYTNFLAGGGNLVDYTDGIQILSDGTVGWGATFYPFDVVYKPHLHLVTDFELRIDSPLTNTIGSGKTLRCCN